jgi:HK97 family phage major capsid protein
MAFATVEKVSAAFEAAGEKINTIDLRSQELEACVKQLQNQLKRILQSVHSATRADDSGGRFGIWASEDQAKTFGECIFAALGRQKEMGEITNVGGGVLVPDELQNRFINLLPRYGKFRSNALVLPMGSASAWVPKLETDMTVNCTGEGATIDPSDAEFSQVRMTPKTWSALAKISSELEEDSIIAIGVILGLSIARSMARMEDLAGFLGDGTSTYFGHKGILGAFHSVSDTISEIAGLAVGSGNTYAELTLKDFQKTVGLLPSEYDDGAKWFMSKKFFYNVVWPLAETAGVAGIYEILSDKKTRHLLGYPVEFVPCMPTAEANSQICAILGDLSAGAFLAQRKGLAIQKSEHAFFANNQLGIRGIQRVDFSVYGVGDTTNPGPIVGLITAAS